MDFQGYYEYKKTDIGEIVIFKVVNIHLLILRLIENKGFQP